LTPNKIDQIVNVIVIIIVL